MKKFLSIMITVAMVLSLVQGFAPKPVAKAVMPDLNVVILSPEDGTTSIMKEDCFYVNAVISNKGITPINTTATLTIDGNATTADGSKPIILGDHGTTDVWWKVCCTDLGPVTLTVTAGAGSDSVKVYQGGETEEKKLVVTWIETPCKQEDLFPVDPTTHLPQVPVGTEFTVKVDVESLFNCAKNVNVTISYSGGLVLLTPETVSIDSICKNQHADAGWRFRCTDEGDASVYIEDVTADGLDFGQVDISGASKCKFHQGPAHPVQPQGEWDIDVDAPEKVCTDCAENTFTISATATNPDAAHGGTTADDVYAELTISDFTLATFSNFAMQRQYIGTVNAGGTTPQIDWAITCLRKGPTSFTVTFYEDGTEELGSGTAVVSETVVVNQNDYLVTVDDVYPGPGGFIENIGDDVYATEECDTFFVKTTFKNCTCNPVPDVIAHVTLDNNAELTGFVIVQEYTVDETGVPHEKGAPYQIPASAIVNNGYNLDLTTDCACCYFEVTWQFKCLESDGCQDHDVVFSAYKDSVADSNLLDSDSFKLVQKSSPKLSAGINIFPGWFNDSTLGTTEITGVASACQGGSLGANSNFTVVVPVANLGDVTADDVYVKIEMNGAFIIHAAKGIDGDGTVINPLTPVDGTLDFGNDSETFYIGTLNGLCAGDNAYKILIEGICNGDPDVHITVGDAKFDQNKVLSGGQALKNDPLIKFYDVNGNGLWDNGEPIVYDTDNDDTVTAGDIAISGALPANGTALIDDPLIKFYDVNGNGLWDNGEPIVYNTDDSGTYSRGLSGMDSLTGLPIPFKDKCGDLNFYLPEEKTLEQIPLDFELVEPAADSSIYVGDCIFPKIIVRNCSTDGNVIQGLTATISWEDGEPAELDESYAPQTQTFAELSGVGGESTNIWEPSWHVCCTGKDDVHFTITLTATNPGMTLTKTFTVHQLLVGDLSVDILSPVSNDVYMPIYATGQQFAVTAKVTYTSIHADEPAENVSVTIDGGDYAVVVNDPNTSPATIDLGEVPDGYEHTFTWTMQCSKPSSSPSGDPITVEATGSNVNDDSDTINVFQYPAAKLVVNLDPIPDVDKGSDFTITGTIGNYGWADATSVVLTMNASSNLMPQAGYSFTLLIGTVPAKRDNANYQAIPFMFHVQCEDAGKTTITVTPSGADEYGFSWLWENRVVQDGSITGSDFIQFVQNVMFNHGNNPYALKPIPDFCIVPYSTTFEQILPGGPMLNITSPLDGFTTNSSDVTVVFSTTGGTVPYIYAAKVDDAAWVSPIPTGSYAFHNLTDGNHTLYIMVTDSYSKYYIDFVNVTIDKTAPPAPVANPVGGTYQGEQNVTLLDAEDGVTFYYALDDPDLPLASFILYSTPITIDEGLHLIRAYAVDAAGNKSSVMIQSYTIVPATVTFDIPLIAGWNFISVPFTTSTSAFTNCSLFIGQSGPVTTLELGKGYFVLNTGAAEVVTVSGIPNASGFEIAATGNWQFIGNPFEVPVDWSSITGAHITLAFYLDTATSTWEMVTLSTDSMQPGVGYIIITSDIGYLVFQRP